MQEKKPTKIVSNVDLLQKAQERDKEQVTEEKAGVAHQKKAILATQIPFYNQLSPFWQEFYYQVINKIEA